nr:hypothetical protein [uncultured Sphingomonas sp.]
MRLTPLVLCLGLAASATSVAVVGQRPDDQISPLSTQFQKKGDALASTGKYVDADDQYETALAIDPRNRSVFVSMARVAIKQKLYGQAITLTKKALVLEPTDRDALAVQGEAMVELGAVARAKDNLAKLQKICGPSSCAQAGILSGQIARGPTLAAATPKPDAEKKN